MAKDRVVPYEIDTPRKFRLTDDQARRIDTEFRALGDDFEYTLSDGVHSCDDIEDVITSFGESDPQVNISADHKTEDRYVRLRVRNVLGAYLCYFPEAPELKGVALGVDLIMRENVIEGDDRYPEIKFGDAADELESEEASHLPNPKAASNLPPPHDHIGEYSYDIRPTRIYLNELEDLADLFRAETGGATLMLDSKSVPLDEVKDYEAPFEKLTLSSDRPAIVLTYYNKNHTANVSCWLAAERTHRTNSILLRAKDIAERNPNIVGSMSASGASGIFNAAGITAVGLGEVTTLLTHHAEYLLASIVVYVACFCFGMQVLFARSVKVRFRPKHEGMWYHARKAFKSGTFWAAAGVIVAAIGVVVLWLSHSAPPSK